MKNKFEYFSADWCVPCKSIGPVVEKLAADYGVELVKFSVDDQDSREAVTRYGIQNIPALVVNGTSLFVGTGITAEAIVPLIKD